MKICSKSFRPKWSFVELVPGDADEAEHFAGLADDVELGQVVNQEGDKVGQDGEQIHLGRSNFLSEIWAMFERNIILGFFAFLINFYIFAKWILFSKLTYLLIFLQLDQSCYPYIRISNV
jgi:hypothetical protein